MVCRDFFSAVSSKEEVKSLNSYLDTLQNKAYDIHRHLVDHHIPVTLKYTAGPI